MLNTTTETILNYDKDLKELNAKWLAKEKKDVERFLNDVYYYSIYLTPEEQQAVQKYGNKFDLCFEQGSPCEDTVREYLNQILDFAGLKGDY